MARPLRIQYPGAIYHVMNRGDQREDIFRDDQDRDQFLGTLTEACCKTMFTQRMKQSGMSWNIHSGQTIVDLRVAYLSQTWEAMFDACVRLLAPMFRQDAASAAGES